MRIGAHTSIAKGMLKALDNIQTMGANCMQIFSSSPRSFNPPHVPDELCAQFKDIAQKRDIGPNFIHATYLINLASANKEQLKKSIDSLVADLVFASKTGIAGVVVHTGSHVGAGFEAVVETVIGALKTVMQETPEGSQLFLEVASGGKGKIGSSFEELQILLKSVSSPRLGVFLDTAHLFVGGRDFDTAEKVATFSDEIKRTVGWEKVGGMHTNDSKGAFGSFLDRHENIGKGHIGLLPFKLLLSDPQFSKLPFILEVPGMDDKGPDKANIDILKSLI